MTALAAYESGLRVGSGCWVNDEDGARVELPLRRWLDNADSCDQRLLDWCHGPTLDVGCGPGRLTVELTLRGVDACGIDISSEAVRIARARGARAFRRDVFGPVEGSGSWSHVLLADGNIGIGGSPVTLLRRTANLIGPSGSIVVELEPPGLGLRSQMVRLEAHGHRGWMAWAHVGIDAANDVAQDADLVVLDHTVSRTGRHFVKLAKKQASVDSHV